MRRSPIPATPLALASLLLTLAAGSAQAFCGFYVAKADTTLWNEASQVAIVRDGERTVLTMSNDYKGALTEFALVVPVPVVLQKEQIHVTERRYMDRLDSFSAPRLVEYFDPDPCHPVVMEMALPSAAATMDGVSGGAAARAKALGVTIEAQYTVGEYDILILGAKESGGLEIWLRENGYKLPTGASAALAPYIRQEMKFFVAKVNLKEQAKTGYSYLRPLQMAFDSPRFMLPIRLGMINAKGPQDLVIFTLTRKGRVETQNYRGVRIPSDVEIPVFIKSDFGRFYKDLFATAWEKEGRKATFLEYFWDMSWCDPCAADPLTPEELRELGVFWLEGGAGGGAGGSQPPGAADVLLTRLHVRYDAEHFPEDLMFQETADRENFQGRYILRHPFTGKLDCDAGRTYQAELRRRQEQEATIAANLSGWPIDEIRRKMAATPKQVATGPAEPPAASPSPSPTPPRSWWDRLWNR